MDWMVRPGLRRATLRCRFQVSGVTTTLSRPVSSSGPGLTSDQAPTYLVSGGGPIFLDREGPRLAAAPTMAS